MSEQDKPRHDGKLAAMGDKSYEAKIEFFDVHLPAALLVLSGGYGLYDEDDTTVYIDPKQALSLLAWLRQEESALETLAKEQTDQSDNAQKQDVKDA